MPGSSPQEAFKNFRDPIQESLKYLGSAKLVGPESGSLRVDQSAVVSIAEPMRIKSAVYPNGLQLEMSIAFKVILDEEKGPYRCTTLSYIHTISTMTQGSSAKKRILAFHWHPDSADSPEHGPHIHPGPVFIPHEGTIHIPGTRATVEYIVRLLIEHFGAKTPAGRDRASDLEHLGRTEGLHVEHRSWHSYNEGKSRSPFT